MESKTVCSLEPYLFKTLEHFYNDHLRVDLIIDCEKFHVFVCQLFAYFNKLDLSWLCVNLPVRYEVFIGITLGHAHLKLLFLHVEFSLN